MATDNAIVHVKVTDLPAVRELVGDLSRAVAVLVWLADQIGLEPDPEDGVWLATNMGRVLRLPLDLDTTLRRVLADEDYRTGASWDAHIDGSGSADA